MSRLATYLTKFKNLISTSPVLYSDQNTEVNQIYQNFNDLDAGVALKNGEATEKFRVDDAVSDDEAVNKGQLDSLTINIKRTLQIDTGETITAGDFVELINTGKIKKFTSEINTKNTPKFFKEAIVNEMEACLINTNKFAIAYVSSTNAYVVVGTVSETEITFGTEVQFNSGTTIDPSICEIDTDKFAIAYRDDSTVDGKAIIGTVFRTDITLGTEQIFESSNSNYNTISKLDTDKFVITYSDIGNSDYGTAIAATVSGTVMTFGTAQVFESAITLFTETAQLDTDKFVIAYRDGGNSNYGTAIAATVSGTVMTFGTAQVFESAITSLYKGAVSKLDTDKFVIAYRDEGNSNYGTAVIGTLSGTVISVGTPQVFESAASNSISIDTIDTDKFVIAYRDEGNSNYGTYMQGSVSGTVMTFGTAQVFDSTSVVYSYALKINANKVLISYQDVSTGNYGKAVILNKAEKPIGTAKESGIADDFISIILNGISNQHSGLSIAEEYFLDGEDLSIITGSYEVGIALSTTELLLDIQRT